MNNVGVAAPSVVVGLDASAWTHLGRVCRVEATVFAPVIMSGGGSVSVAALQGMALLMRFANSAQMVLFLLVELMQCAQPVRRSKWHCLVHKHAQTAFGKVVDQKTPMKIVPVVLGARLASLAWVYTLQSGRVHAAIGGHSH